MWRAEIDDESRTEERTERCSTAAEGGWRAIVVGRRAGSRLRQPAKLLRRLAAIVLQQAAQALLAVDVAERRKLRLSRNCSNQLRLVFAFVSSSLSFP